MNLSQLLRGDTQRMHGSRLLVLCTGYAVPALRDVIVASAKHARHCRQGAVVLVAHRATFAAAVALAGDSLSIGATCLQAAGHAWWRCACPPKGTTSARMDAFVSDLAPLEHAAVSMMAIRRGLSQALYTDLTTHVRRDNLRRGILEGAFQPRRYATKPSAHSARQLGAGDPAWHISEHYRGARPVAAQGVLDNEAVRDGRPLPVRRPDDQDGTPALTKDQVAAARELFPPAAEIDPYAFADGHRTHCALCKSVTKPFRPNGSARPVRISTSCYFWALFRRCLFGILFVCHGFRGPDPRKRRLEERYAKGHLPDLHPGASRAAPLHHPSIFEDEVNTAAYKKGMGKWYGATGMCVPVHQLDIPGLDVPDGEGLVGWRPPNVIPQKVVIKAKDYHKWRFGARLNDVPASRLRVPSGTIGTRAKLRPNDAVEVRVPGAGLDDWTTAWVIELRAADADVVLPGPTPKGRTVCNLAPNFNEFYADGGCFRYTGVETFTAQLEPGDFIAVVDIKSFFLKLPMAEAMYKFLLFQDAFSKEVGYQVHTRLPFGASLAPYYASTVSSEVLEILRSRGRAAARRHETRRAPSRQRHAAKVQGHDYWLGRWGARQKSSAYMDDVGLAAAEREATAAAVRELVAILRRLGIPATDKDGTWEPRQSQIFLGILICTISRFTPDGPLIVEQTIPLPYQDYARHQLELVLATQSITGDRLESLIGCLSWVCCVQLGGRARMAALREFKSVGRAQMAHDTYDLTPVRVASQRRNALRFKRALLINEVIEDLEWFARRLAAPEWTGSRVLNLVGTDPVLTVSVKSDAAGELGSGWYELTPAGGVSPRHGSQAWTPSQHVAWKGDMLTKELFPVLLAARACGASWRGKVVRFGVDNSGVVDVLNRGRARKANARGLLRELGDLQAIHGFELVAAWVPREFNEVADGLSRGYTLRRAWVEGVAKESRLPQARTSPGPAAPPRRLRPADMVIWGVPLDAPPGG